MQLLLQKIADKFIELSNIGFSMECFIADFSRFFGTTVQICLLSDPLGTGHQVQSISQIFLIFFFFSCVGTMPPPQRRKYRGDIFRWKTIFTYIYKI